VGVLFFISRFFYDATIIMANKDFHYGALCCLNAINELLTYESWSMAVVFSSSVKIDF